MKILLKFLALSVFSVCINHYILNSQTVTVSAAIDTNNVLIGDQVGLTLKAVCKPKTRLVWPAVPDTIGPLEVLSRSPIDTLDINGTYRLSRKFILTCFDSGRYEIPPFVFMYEKKGFSDLYPKRTEPIYLNFATMPVDTTKPIKDIKGPIEEPITFDEYIPYILIGLAVVIVLDAVYFFIWLRRRPKLYEDLDYDPNIPAHIIALEGLKQLDAEKLWHKRQVKKYHIRLTDIIRKYIERRFGVLALEMITDEIIDGMSKTDVEGELIDQLRAALTLADLVKFAKFQPLSDENALSMKTAFDFVYKTIQTAPGNDKMKEEEK